MKKLIDAIKKMLGMSDKPSSDSSSQGFTLIELLVVIAVIGVLAAAVLIAIDPVQQLARGRDSGRKQSLAQVGRAMEAYYTANASYLSGTNWLTNLAATGEIKLVPTGYGTPAITCTNIENNICIVSDTDSFVVYTVLESKAENSGKPAGTGQCAVGGTTQRYYVYSSLAGRAGTACGSTLNANFSGPLY